MPLVNLCCPKCLSKGTRSQLISDPNKISCASGCTFEDTNELMSFKLEPFSGKAFTPPAAKPPEGAVTFTIAIESKLRDALQARFGDRVNDNIVALLGTMANKGCFIVPADEVQRYIAIVGKQPKDSGELFGMFFNMHRELEDAKERIKLAQASGVSSGAAGGKDTSGGLFIDMDMEHLTAIAEKAAFNGKSVKAHVSEMVVYALDQGWL